MALNTKMKTRVQDTSPVSQAHLDLSTAEIPKKMKMMVSAMLARFFMVYLIVVRDFWEMLASTYLLAPMPQKVILWTETRRLTRRHTVRNRTEGSGVNTVVPLYRTDLRQNGRQREELRGQVGQVDQQEDEERLDDAHLLGEASDKAEDHGEDQTHQRSPDANYEKRGYGGAEGAAVTPDASSSSGVFRTADSPTPLK